MRLETKELAKLLVNSQNLASHPDGHGRRLVGYVISDEHYPSDGLFALRHISNVFNSHDLLTAEVARLRELVQRTIKVHTAPHAMAMGSMQKDSKYAEKCYLELLKLQKDCAKALNPEEPK